MKAEQKVFSTKDDLKIESFGGFKEHESILHKAINSFISQMHQKKEELVKEIIRCVFAIDNHYLVGFCQKHISCVSYDEKPNEEHYFYNFGLKDEKLLAVFYPLEIENPSIHARLSYELKYWSCLDNE